MLNLKKFLLSLGFLSIFLPHVVYGSTKVEINSIEERQGTFHTVSGFSFSEEVSYEIPKNVYEHAIDEKFPKLQLLLYQDPSYKYYTQVKAIYEGLTRYREIPPSTKNMKNIKFPTDIKELNEEKPIKIKLTLFQSERSLRRSHGKNKKSKPNTQSCLIKLTSCQSGIHLINLDNLFVKKSPSFLKNRKNKVPGFKKEMQEQILALSEKETDATEE